MEIIQYNTGYGIALQTGSYFRLQPELNLYFSHLVKWKQIKKCGACSHLLKKISATVAKCGNECDDFIWPNIIKNQFLHLFPLFNVIKFIMHSAHDSLHLCTAVYDKTKEINSRKCSVCIAECREQKSKYVPLQSKC